MKALSTIQKIYSLITIKKLIIKMRGLKYVPKSTSWLNCTEMFFLTIFVQLILIHLSRLILQLGPLGSTTQSAILSSTQSHTALGGV